MTRTKGFHNRKGIHWSLRGTRHCEVMAKLEFKREICMLPREMRAYWDERNTPLYGPLSLASRRISEKPSVAAWVRKNSSPGRGFKSQAFTELPNGVILAQAALEV